MRSLRRKPLLWLTLLAMATMMILRLWPRTPLLLAHARLVADTRDWHLLQLEIINYRWLSAHEVLYLGGNPRKEGYALTRHDTLTGKEARLIPATRAFRPAIGMNEFKELSPDGKWLLWEEVFKHEIGVADLAGKSHFHYPKIGVLAQWMADSRHWIEWMDNRRLRIHDIAAPAIFQELAIPPDSLLLSQNREVESSWLPSLSHFRLLTHRNTSEDDYSISQIMIIDAGLGADAMPPHQTTILLPCPADNPEIALSPQGDQIAYLLHCKRPSPLHVLLHRIVSSVKVPVQETQSLWVSRADGTDMHEVGRDEIMPGQETKVSLGRWLRWLPNNTELSFIRNNHLYVVPAH